MTNCLFFAQTTTNHLQILRHSVDTAFYSEFDFPENVWKVPRKTQSLHCSKTGL